MAAHNDFGLFHNSLQQRNHCDIAETLGWYGSAKPGYLDSVCISMLWY